MFIQALILLNITSQMFGRWSGISAHLEALWAFSWSSLVVSVAVRFRPSSRQWAGRRQSRRLPQIKRPGSPSARTPSLQHRLHRTRCSHLPTTKHSSMSRKRRRRRTDYISFQFMTLRPRDHKLIFLFVNMLYKTKKEKKIIYWLISIIIKFKHNVNASCLVFIYNISFIYKFHINRFII